MKSLYRISKRSIVLSPLDKRGKLGINEGPKSQKNDDSFHLKKNRLFGNFQLPKAYSEVRRERSFHCGEFGR